MLLSREDLVPPRWLFKERCVEDLYIVEDGVGICVGAAVQLILQHGTQGKGCCYFQRGAWRHTSQLSASAIHSSPEHTMPVVSGLTLVYPTPSISSPVYTLLNRWCWFQPALPLVVHYAGTDGHNNTEKCLSLFQKHTVWNSYFWYSRQFRFSESSEKNLSLPCEASQHEQQTTFVSRWCILKRSNLHYNTASSSIAIYSCLCQCDFW